MSIDRGMNKKDVVYIQWRRCGTYDNEYCSAIKKSEIMSFYINMDGPRDYDIVEVRQRKTNILSYMCNPIF